jgi:hypothetical protein
MIAYFDVRREACITLRAAGEASRAEGQKWACRCCDSILSHGIRVVRAVRFGMNVGAWVG